MRRFFSLAGVALLWSACASPPPSFIEELAVDAPSQWTSRLGETNGVSADWIALFDDPALELIVEEVWRDNYSLQGSLARLEQAGYQAKIAAAGRWPQLEVGAQGGRQKQNFIGFPDFLGLQEGVFSSLNNQWGISLDVRWEIDLWGRVRAGQSAALGEAQAALADFQAVRVSLAAQTCKVYFALIEAQQQVELAQKTVESFLQTEEMIEKRYRRGALSSALDLRLAKSDTAEAEAILAQSQDQLQRVARQLEILLGNYPAGKKRLRHTYPTLPPAPAAGLPSELLHRRPDLIAAERRLAAADKRIVEAQRDLLPRIALTGSAGTSSDELSDLINSDFSVWNIAGNILQPLFQGGRLRNRVRFRKAQLRESAAGYARVALDAFAEVENALDAEEFFRRRENSLQEVEKQASASFALAEQEYRRGVIDINTLLSAQRRSLRAKTELISIERLRLENRIDLHLALGGGYSMNFQGAGEAVSSLPTSPLTTP